MIVESFERIHRSNLIGMGVLPLQFLAGVNRETLGMTGDETINLTGLSDGVTPAMTVKAEISFADGRVEHIDLLARIDTDGEAAYFKKNMFWATRCLAFSLYVASLKRHPFAIAGRSFDSLNVIPGCHWNVNNFTHFANTPCRKLTVCRLFDTNQADSVLLLQWCKK